MIKHPIEGLKGAEKGAWNTIPDLGTMILQAAVNESIGWKHRHRTAKNNRLGSKEQILAAMKSLTIFFLF